MMILPFIVPIRSVLLSARARVIELGMRRSHRGPTTNNFSSQGLAAASRRPRFKYNRGRAGEDMPFRSAHNVHRMHRPTINRSGQKSQPKGQGCRRSPNRWTRRYHNRYFSKTPSADRNWARSSDRLARDREYPQIQPMFADVRCHIAYIATLSRGAILGKSHRSA